MTKSRFPVCARGCGRSGRILRTRTSARRAPGISDRQEVYREVASNHQCRLSSRDILKGQNSARLRLGALSPNTTHRHLPTTLLPRLSADRGTLILSTEIRVCDL